MQNKKKRLRLSSKRPLHERVKQEARIVNLCLKIKKSTNTNTNLMIDYYLRTFINLFSTCGHAMLKPANNERPFAVFSHWSINHFLNLGW